MYQRSARSRYGSAPSVDAPSIAVPGRVPLGGRLPPRVARPGAGTGVAQPIYRGAPAKSPAPAPDEGQARAQFDTPGHIGGGDSVPGETVNVRGIPFTAGELAALVDFVGDLSILQDRNVFTFEQIARMHQLLEMGVEDAWAWDEATGGLYSREAQDNEKHFAPAAGDGGQNFRDQFIDYFAKALVAMGQGDRDGAKLLSYTAEHYLQDAFSAGHQLAAKDVQSNVDDVMWLPSDGKTAPEIAGRVFAQKSAVISRYDAVYGSLVPVELGLKQFTVLAIAGALWKGNAGVGDAVRRFVHEQLAKSGVEVTSLAHPTPFLLYGDHDLGAPESARSVEVMQHALAETRALLNRGAADEGAAKTIATTHFERHCPMPTAKGRTAIETAMESGTADQRKIVDAVVDSLCGQIEDVMHNIVDMTAGPTGLAFKVVPRVPEQLHPHPPTEVAPYDPYDPYRTSARGDQL
jgi:hypothetical protein